MKLSVKGLAMIRRFEGCRLGAYQDGGGVWTIGYGHTGSEVVRGLSWTQEKADEHLAQDVARFEVAVTRGLTRAATQGQFDPMVSLAFNVGAEAFAKSTLLRKFNMGDVQGAFEQFSVWHKDNGVFQPGLLARRVAESWVFARGSA